MFSFWKHLIFFFWNINMCSMLEDVKLYFKNCNKNAQICLLLQKIIRLHFFHLQWPTITFLKLFYVQIVNIFTLKQFSITNNIAFHKIYLKMKLLRRGHLEVFLTPTLLVNYKKPFWVLCLISIVSDTYTPEKQCHDLERSHTF